jgi:cholesterol oxidase
MTHKNYYDYVVIGSGFGGSVAAMRLSQKGYKTLVIESGKRWKKDDFPETNWNIGKFLWMPNIFLYGIQRMNMLNDIFILSGAGVGGGSLNYANTLYIPTDTFFEKESVKQLGGKNALLPYYKLAEKMLGATENIRLTEQDSLLKETAKEYKREKTFRRTPVAVYFGEEGKEADDPYFFGEGPKRTGCELCGGCMTGCKKDAKNTLDKNYLYFAEKFGAEILPEHKVIDIIPFSNNNKQEYKIKTKKTTASLGKLKGNTYFAKNIVIAAGTLGTLELLLKLKQTKRLPKISDTIGEKVRTNSEAIIGVKSKDKNVDFSKGVAITSSIFIDENTHIEPVRYKEGNDFMSLLTVPLTDGGGKIPRQLKFIRNILKHPIDFLKTLYPFGWAKKSIILLVMQTHDNYINILRKRRLIFPFVKTLTSKQATDKKNPTYIPIANQFARKLAKKINGIPASILTEVLMNAPLTAHIMGGCAFSNKVIDKQNRLIGYKNIIITDGSQIPENLGVNPSLSITAFAERAMSFIPPKDGKTIKYLKAEEVWKVKELIYKNNNS